MSDLTRQALASALKQLLQDKSLKDITVKDLTDACGLNRQTFYYHFDDIPDLIEWICVTETERILKDHYHYDSWEEGFRDIFKLILQKRSFVINIYESSDPKILMRYLFRLVYPLLLGVVNEEAINYPSVSRADKEFIAKFYTDAFVGLVLSWIEDGMKEDPKFLVSHLSKLIKGTFSQALGKYSKEGE